MFRWVLPVFLMVATGAVANVPCRQALALALDVSGSVDRREYRLQLDGLAAALNSPAVRKAILTTPQAPIHIAVYEWSGPGYQRLLVDWTPLADAQVLDRTVSDLQAVMRMPAPPATGLGAAMAFGVDLLAQRAGCWKRTLDISGDGKHNVGRHPRDVQEQLGDQALTINGLVIGVDAPQYGDTRQVEIAELSSYFRAWVIHGPGAFVETALGFDDYEAAMTRKLLRELEGVVVSSLR